MKELTKSEEQVMQVIWKIGQGFANEIMTAFPEPKPAYNTVLTMVRILEKKGFVGHETFCKANRYFPLVSKEEYSQNSLKGLVSNYFNGSYTELVSAFTKKENFTMEQLQELKKMIEEAIEEER
ncbi:MAG: BlaI/MecI/CopY family transcriptional regulator [Bacteroidales bacterium]|nr:BlaI/MecI/CopY family transcriptional regulator [Bacteroidales bacterium]